MNALDDCEEPEILAEDILDPQDCETVCNICSAEFLDPQDLKQHLTQVHASEVPNIVQCHFCTSSLSDLEKYALHIRDYHLKTLKICTYCTKVFVDFDQYKKHERSHFCPRKNYVSCSQCSEVFPNNGELERHEFEDHNNDEDGFMLQELFPMLSTVLNMKAVDFLQSMNSRHPCECGYCGFISAEVDEYVLHLKKGKCRCLSCHNCSYTHKEKPIIIRHIRRHKECFNAVKDVKRKCTECQERILARFYKNHIKDCRPMKCMPCNIVFSTMEQLSTHQTNNHPLSIEVKLCKFCNRQCVGAYSLRRHMFRVHKHDVHLYKYKCVTCDTPFKHPQKLFAHYFIKHRELEPYTCKICDKKFRIRKRFTIHIKLDHKSVGFVEFDKNYHVFFTEKRSENPFVPSCVIPKEELIFYAKMPSRSKPKRREKITKLNLDILNQTETEGNITEVETAPKKKILKRKIKNTKPNAEVIPLESTDDDDVPLMTLKKPKTRVERKPVQLPWIRRKKSTKDNKEQLTCKFCNKYCYTYQNFQHHMSLHRKNDGKACIKCSQVFKSMDELNQHIETAHSTSKLTETLKSLLEKRKKTIAPSNILLTTTEKFQNTIKKSRTESLNPTTAKITEVDKPLSVKKFLETFTPESDLTPNVVIKNCVTIKKVADPFYRKSSIQMIRFVPTDSPDNPKLNLPTKFNPGESEPVKCTIKVVETPVQQQQEDFFTEQYDEGIDKDESIPEVAQEVMLEVTEELPKVQAPTKIVVPTLPKGCENLSIAHLQAEAPYYKIVKLNNIQTEAAREEIRKDLIKLPDGTQMVTVNPLAHLLGDKNVEEILQPLKNKYYKPKTGRNVENLLTKALEKANTPTNMRKRKATARKIQREYSFNDM